MDPQTANVVEQFRKYRDVRAGALDAETVSRAILHLIVTAPESVPEHARDAWRALFDRLKTTKPTAGEGSACASLRAMTGPERARFVDDVEALYRLCVTPQTFS